MRATLIIFPLFYKETVFQKVMELLQLVLGIYIGAITVLSFKQEDKVHAIKYLLFV